MAYFVRVAVGHLWYNSGTNFAGSVSADTLRDYPYVRTIRNFKSPALGLKSTALFRDTLYTYQLSAWVELLRFAVKDTRVWPAKREACVQYGKEMLQESALKRYRWSHCKPTALLAPARSSFKLYQVLFHDSKYSQPYHMYIPIARRWQEITRLLPLKAGLRIYSSLSYIGFMVYSLDKDWILMQQVFSSNTYNLMQQYII
jgi:hypothetical protein